MYDYRCKDYENSEQDMPREDMPMMNMPMMPMMNMPMMNMPIHDEDLKSMYPKIYIMIYPMVKNHCDMMISRYGTMHCPSKDEMDHMCKEVCDKYEKYYRDDDDEDMRDSFRQGRRSPIQDLTRILFINELLGRRRRRRRRRRRMFHHGY